MKREIILKVVFVLILSNALCFCRALAQEGDSNGLISTETFLNSLNVDLPEAEITCTAGGSLTEIIHGTTSFKSGGNALFVDKVNNEIGLFEKAVFDSSIDKSKKNTADIFIKVPNVTRENLVDLLLNKHLVVSRNAQVIFLVRVKTDTGQDTYIYDGRDKDGNIITSTLYTRVKKLGNITFKGEKFLAVNGQIKIRFPQPPKKVKSDGSFDEVFSDSQGTLVCRCKNCPLSNFDLSELQSAFDGDLVNDIIHEANGSNLGE